MTLIIHSSSDFIKEGTVSSFKSDVIEKSQTMLVLVDFWAAWCGPCLQLKPLLEQAVLEAKGKVCLVKIDTELYSELTQQYRIQTLPTVLAFKNGQVVDVFTGIIGFTQIKSFIAKLLGLKVSPFEGLLDMADQASQQKDFISALSLYTRVLEKEPQNIRALVGLSQGYLAMSDLVNARLHVEKIPTEAAPEIVKSLKETLELSLERLEMSPTWSDQTAKKNF